MCWNLKEMRKVAIKTLNRSGVRSVLREVSLSGDGDDETEVLRSDLELAIKNLIDAGLSERDIRDAVDDALCGD